MNKALFVVNTKQTLNRIFELFGFDTQVHKGRVMFVLKSSSVGLLVLPPEKTN